MVKIDTGKDKSYHERVIGGKKRILDMIESMHREEQREKEEQEM